MTKAVFKRSTRVARPKRTGRRFFARIPLAARPSPGGITRSVMATPTRTNARGAALVPLGHDRSTSSRPCHYLFVFSPDSVHHSTTFYYHALRWASENMPGFLGKEQRQLSGLEDMLFDRTIPFDQKAS